MARRRAREAARPRGGWRASLPARALLPPCPPHACVRCGQGCGVGVCAASRTKQGQEQGEGEGGAGHLCWVSEEVRGGEREGRGGRREEGESGEGGAGRAHALSTHTVFPRPHPAQPRTPVKNRKKKRKRTRTHTHTHGPRGSRLSRRERGAPGQTGLLFPALGRFPFFFGSGFGPAPPRPPTLFFICVVRARAPLPP